MGGAGTGLGGARGDVDIARRTNAAYADSAAGGDSWPGSAGESQVCCAEEGDRARARVEGHAQVARACLEGEVSSGGGARAGGGQYMGAEGRTRGGRSRRQSPTRGRRAGSGESAEHSAEGIREAATGGIARRGRATGGRLDSAPQRSESRFMTTSLHFAPPRAFAEVLLASFARPRFSILLVGLEQHLVEILPLKVFVVG